MIINCLPLLYITAPKAETNCDYPFGRIQVCFWITHALSTHLFYALNSSELYKHSMNDIFNILVSLYLYNVMFPKNQSVMRTFIFSGALVLLHVLLSGNAHLNPGPGGNSDTANNTLPPGDLSYTDFCSRNSLGLCISTRAEEK